MYLVMSDVTLVTSTCPQLRICVRFEERNVPANGVMGSKLGEDARDCTKNPLKLCESSNKTEKDEYMSCEETRVVTKVLHSILFKLNTCTHTVLPCSLETYSYVFCRTDTGAPLLH